MSSSLSNNTLSFTAEKMIYQSIQRFSVINLNDLIRVLMENIDDSLFELSDKAKNDSDRNMYFDAMREIRLKRDSIKDTFNHELEQKFSKLLNNEFSKKSVEISSELSLLDQDELEDSLAIDNMISKARPHFEDELFAISERLKAILSRKDISEDQNPLDPKSICDSFHNASEVLEFEIKVKLIFYKLFDKFVMTNLGHFYSELNQYFIKKGVLVDFKASEERANQTTQFMANRIRSNPNAQKEKEELNSSLAQQSIESDLQNMQAPEGSLMSFLQQMISSPNKPQSDIPMIDMNLSGSPTINSSNSPQNSLVGLSPAAQNTAYLSALSNLQNINSTVSTVHSDADPQEFKTQLQQQLVQFKEDNSHQSSTIDNQVIDIVSMIFDFFFEDEALPNPIKVLIGRLQIPILKVAIIDNSFFNSKKHPARKLLDNISKASLGWTNNKQQEQRLINKVEEIVSTLLINFNDEINVFEIALNDFLAFINLEKNQSKELIEDVINDEQANDDKITNAQEQSHIFIQSLINKHELSFDIIDFLDGIWKSIVYQTLLTQGEDSTHWKNIKHITITLVWTLIVKQSDNDKKKLFKTLPALLRAMSKGMDLIQLDTEGKNEVFQMLVKEHAKIVKLSNQSIVTRVDDETVWPQKNAEDAFAKFNTKQNEKNTIDFNLADLDSDPTNEDDSIHEINHADTQDVIQNLDEFTASIANGDIQIGEEIIMDSSPNFHQTHLQTNSDQDDFQEIAQALELNTWVEFNEINSEPIQGKLSWKSNVTGKYVFVNRHGEKIKNITSYGLAVELRSGNAKLIESSSIFDRALNSLMTSIGR